MNKFAAYCAAGFGLILVLTLEFGVTKYKYDVCRETGRSPAACVFFAGIR